jgi:hypothetical protein
MSSEMMSGVPNNVIATVSTILLNWQILLFSSLLIFFTGGIAAYKLSVVTNNPA